MEKERLQQVELDVIEKNLEKEKTKRNIIMCILHSVVVCILLLILDEPKEALGVFGCIAVSLFAGCFSYFISFGAFSFVTTMISESDLTEKEKGKRNIIMCIIYSIVAGIILAMIGSQQSSEDLLGYIVAAPFLGIFCYFINLLSFVFVTQTFTGIDYWEKLKIQAKKDPININPYKADFDDED